MRGLCQHTDAILVNTDKAGLLVGKIGGWGWGRLLNVFITVVS